MAPVIADHPFRQAGGPGGVEDVERVGGFDLDAIRRRGPGDELLPIEVAAGDHRRWNLRPLEHDAVLRLVPGQLDGLVDERFVLQIFAPSNAPEAVIRTFGVCMIDPHCQFRRGETAEHHRMNRSEAGAREHRHDRLGNHRHVDDDRVALGDAERTECPREEGDVVPELPIGEPPDRLR